MTIATKSVVQLTAGYKAAAKAAEALRDYNQGTAAPATQLGRYTVAEVNALITTAKAALTVLVPN